MPSESVESEEVAFGVYRKPRPQTPAPVETPAATAPEATTDDSGPAIEEPQHQ